MSLCVVFSLFAASAGGSECESHAARDHSAALLIQRRWRGWSARNWLHLCHQNALLIQKSYRGYCGRRRFLLAHRSREESAAKSFFDAQAIRIQKYVRGWISRKYTQDIYARRSYISNVASVGDALLIASDRAESEQILYLASNGEAKRNAQFDSLVSNAHHLLGTKSIPGVFVNPLSGVAATAFDIDMENHIQEAFRNRQAQLRKLRTNVFVPTSATQQQQQQQQQQAVVISAPPAAVAAASVSLFSASNARADSSLSSIDHHPTAIYSPSSAVRGSSSSSGASSRASRPTSGGRLAPLPSQQQQQQQSTAVPASSSSSSSALLAQTQVRGGRSTATGAASSSSSSSSVNLSNASSTSSLHASTTRPQASPNSQNKLPTIRSQQQQQQSSSAAGTPSGRTLDAAQLYASKIHQSEEEKPVSYTHL